MRKPWRHNYLRVLSRRWLRSVVMSLRRQVSDMSKHKDQYSQTCGCGKTFTADGYHAACDKVMDHHAETNWQCCPNIAEAADSEWRWLHAKGLLA